MLRGLTPMLAAIRYERTFDINGTLQKVVKSLWQDGVTVGGVLQEAEFRQNGCCALLNIAISEPEKLSVLHKIAAVNHTVASSIRAVLRPFLIV